MDQADEDYSEPEPAGRIHRFTLRDLATFGLLLMWSGLMLVAFLVVMGLGHFALRKPR